MSVAYMCDVSWSGFSLKGGKVVKLLFSKCEK